MGEQTSPNCLRATSAQGSKANSANSYMNSWHVADQVWRELEFAFVFAFVVSCELIRLGWQESGCPLSQPGLLCFKEVGCL